MAKDGRFYLRLTDEERRMLDAIAVELGLEGNASAAVRFMIRQQFRELAPSLPKRKRKTK